jgi:hypothetical protein
METPPTGDHPLNGDETVETATSADTDETAAADRQKRTDKILADARRRDGVADARDAVSDAREMVADLEAFLGPDDAYHGLDQRRAAAVDRSHAKGDRQASAQDRVELTKQDPEGQNPDGGPYEPKVPPAP